MNPVLSRAPHAVEQIVTFESAQVPEADVIVIETRRQLIDNDPRTHDELRMVILNLIKELEDFTEDEKKALRVRSLFGKNRAHVDMSGHTRAAILKVQNHMVERGKEMSMPSELTEQTLKYFVLGGHNDLDTIYRKLQRSFSEIKIEPRDIERWLGLGFEALFVS